MSSGTKHNLTVVQQDQHGSKTPAMVESLYADFSEDRGDELSAGWQPCEGNKG
jgi:hypothetical protein